MRTLIINGSPRKTGDSMALAKVMSEHLEGEVIFINAYDDGIGFCTDCRYCWTNSECAIKDGMTEVYQLLNEVDHVVIASPIHFYELSAGIFKFASRLQLIFAADYFRKDDLYKQKAKTGVLILSAGGDVKDLEGRALRSANIIFKHMYAKSIGTIMSLNTNEVPAEQDDGAMNQARVFAYKLNELYHERNRF